MSQMDEYKDYLKTILSPERYRHSLCVAKQAVILARQWGGDESKAEIAGLLHDICKEMPEEEQLQYLKARDILLDIPTKSNPWVWHARTGSLLIREKFGIDDQDILNAVQYHTTARIGMTILEEIIYVSDLISEDRDYPSVQLLRNSIDEGLEKAILLGLTFGIESVLKRGTGLMKDTTEAYNYYLLCKDNERGNKPI